MIVTDALGRLREATAALPSTWVSEVVLQTNRYDEMKAWYEAVLGGRWNFENLPKQPIEKSSHEDGNKQVRAVDVRACFMRLDPEFPYGATFAIFELDWLRLAP